MESQPLVTGAALQKGQTVWVTARLPLPLGQKPTFSENTLNFALGAEKYVV